MCRLKSTTECAVAAATADRGSDVPRRSVAAGGFPDLGLRGGTPAKVPVGHPPETAVGGQEEKQPDRPRRTVLAEEFQVIIVRADGVVLHQGVPQAASIIEIRRSTRAEERTELELGVAGFPEPGPNVLQGDEIVRTAVQQGTARNGRAQPEASQRRRHDDHQERATDSCRGRAHEPAQAEQGHDGQGRRRAQESAPAGGEQFAAEQAHRRIAETQPNPWAGAAPDRRRQRQAAHDLQKKSQMVGADIESAGTPGIAFGAHEAEKQKIVARGELAYADYDVDQSQRHQGGEHPQAPERVGHVAGRQEVDGQRPEHHEFIRPGEIGHRRSQCPAQDITQEHGRRPQTKSVRKSLSTP